MNPECPKCDREMLEVESKFENDNGETEVEGYECPVCHIQTDLNGEEI